MAQLVERSLCDQEVWVRNMTKSYKRLQKWYLAALLVGTQYEKVELELVRMSV